MAIRAFVSLAKPTNVVSFSKIETQSTYVKTQAVTFVPRLEASAYRADDSINQWFYESQQATDSGILLNEIFVTVINKNLTDTTILSDLPALNYTFGTKAEIINIADNFTKIVTWNKTFTDAFTLDDLSQIDKDFYGNKGNIFAFTDIIGLTSNKALTDSYTISDVVSKVIAYSRSFTDSTTLSDSDYYSFGKNPSDTLVFSESHLKGFTKPEIDSLTIGDVLANHPSLPKVDSFSFSDSSYFSTGKGASDSIAFSESYYKTLTKIIADAFTLDDSTLINKDYTGDKGNICTITDVIAFAVTYSRVYTDSFVFNDTTITEIAKVINDVITMTDSSNIERGTEYTDIVGFVELIASNVDKVFSLDQTILSDSLVSVFNKGIDDSVSFSDNTVSEIAKVISDAFTLDDSALIDKDYFGSKGNVCTVSDIISFAFIWNRSFTHSFSFNDEDFYLLGKNIEGANENIGISDLVALATISGRVLNGASINTTTLN